MRFKVEHKRCIIRVFPRFFFKKNCANPGLFLFIFVLFSIPTTTNATHNDAFFYVSVLKLTRLERPQHRDRRVDLRRRLKQISGHQGKLQSAGVAQTKLGQFSTPKIVLLQVNFHKLMLTSQFSQINAYKSIFTTQYFLEVNIYNFIIITGHYSII